MATSKTSIVSEIGTAITGRWLEAFGRLAPELQPAIDANGQHVNCPLPGHDDANPSFRIDKPDDGRAICSCGSYSGVGLLMELRDWSSQQTLQALAEFLGIDWQLNGRRRTADLIESVCRDKRMPRAAFEQFNPTVAKRGKRSVVRIETYNGDGERYSYYDLAPGCKGWCKRGTGNAGFFFPGSLPKPGETWLLVESVKDAAALIELGFNAAGMPTCNLNEKFANLFRDVDIVFVPDLDSGGQEGAQVSCRRLSGIAATSRIARLPGEVSPSKGNDVRDILAKVDGKSLVRQAIDDAREGLRKQKSNRVYLSLNEATVAEQTIDVMASIDNLYQRCGELVRIIRHPGGALAGIDVPDETLVLQRPPQAIIRELISDVAEFWLKGEEEERQVSVPKYLPPALHQRGEYPAKIRPITGIVRCPTIRVDGTVSQQPGYDPVSGLFYEPDGEYPLVPEQPTRSDAAQAVAALLDVLADFPFVSEAAKSVWLSMLLTLVGRPAIKGCCPAFCFDASTPGSGKSLLCDVAATITSGQRMPRKAWPRKDEETNKVITSVALEALPCVMLDNIASAIDSASLDAAITATTWHDRLLGTNETIAVPLLTVWCATGNNLVIGSDMARRVLLCRLEPEQENPEERTDFQRRDLIGHVRQERHTLAVAALTILRAYEVAGRPNQPPPLGSFESWSDFVRAAIIWTGQADPIESRSLVKDQDRTGSIFRLILAGITEIDPNKRGVTTRQILEATDCPELVEAIGEICGAKPSPQRVGNTLGKYRGRISGGRQLVCRKLRGMNRWNVEMVGDPGDHGGPVSPDLSRAQENSTPGNRENATGTENRREAEKVHPGPPGTPHTSELGECDDCHDRLVGELTADGYINRSCPTCGRDYTCLKRAY